LSQAARPFGVTVVAVLQILLGILELAGGMVLTFVRFVLPAMFPHVRFFATRSVFSGLGLIVFALVDFILAYGLWEGRGWAWVGSLIFAVIGLVFSALSLFIGPRVGGVVSLVIDLVILYYLMHPGVQGYFGKGKVSAIPLTRSTGSEGR
jgi:hypothetical protein